MALAIALNGSEAGGDDQRQHDTRIRRPSARLLPQNSFLKRLIMVVPLCIAGEILLHEPACDILRKRAISSLKA